MQYIYKITNKINGKFYVGRTLKPRIRFNTHLNLLEKGEHHSIHFQRAWDKYGKDNFEFYVYQVINTGDESEDLEIAQDIEQEFIDEFVPGKGLYNRSHSSKTGVSKGKDHCFYNKKPIEWMSKEGYQNALEKWKSLKGDKNPFYGRKHTEDTIEDLRKKCALYGEENGFFGKKHSDESKEKMKEVKIGKYDGDNNPFYGRTHSPETRRIISDKNKGRLSGIPKSEEQKEKMRISSPKNVRVEIGGKLYQSISEASRVLGVDRKTISYRVNSKTDKFSDYRLVD